LVCLYRIDGDKCVFFHEFTKLFGDVQPVPIHITSIDGEWNLVLADFLKAFTGESDDSVSQMISRARSGKKGGDIQTLANELLHKKSAFKCTRGIKVWVVNIDEAFQFLRCIPHTHTKDLLDSQQRTFMRVLAGDQTVKRIIDACGAATGPMSSLLKQKVAKDAAASGNTLPASTNAPKPNEIIEITRKRFVFEIDNSEVYQEQVSTSTKLLKEMGEAMGKVVDKKKEELSVIKSGLKVKKEDNKLNKEDNTVNDKRVKIMEKETHLLEKQNQIKVKDIQETLMKNFFNNPKNADKTAAYCNVLFQQKIQNEKNRLKQVTGSKSGKKAGAQKKKK
jgi:hypothetical protein